MARWLRAAVLALMALAAVPAPHADARAGGHFSFNGGSYLSQGSRGSRTYNSPMNQSLTPRPSPGTGLPYSYGGYHPFWTGLAGGLFGSLLGRLLFPHWGYGFGFGNLLSGIVLLLVLLWLVRFALRAFAGGSMRTMVGPGSLAYGGMGAASMAGLGTAAPSMSAPLAITGGDYGAFEAILKQVQQAWSSGDVHAMRPVVTPEMLSYFADTLAENQSRGLENHVEQVTLLKGDLREAWDEGRMHYATCYLRWRAIDYTVRLGGRPGDADSVVEGDPRQPVEAAELWTFARSPGGHWLLSAVQQV
jgi:predicted lipid-binding transport protein (Tim44 family)